MTRLARAAWLAVFVVALAVWLLPYDVVAAWQPILRVVGIAAMVFGIVCALAVALFLWLGKLIDADHPGNVERLANPARRRSDPL